MKTAARILVQLLLGTLLGTLLCALIIVFFDILVKPGQASDAILLVVVAASWLASYLGSLLGIKIINERFYKKQKYTWSLIAIPFLIGFEVFLCTTNIGNFLFGKSSEPSVTEMLLLLSLVFLAQTLLMILATHLESFLRKRYKISRR